MCQLAPRLSTIRVLRVARPRWNGLRVRHAQLLHHPAGALISSRSASHHLVISGDIKAPVNKSCSALRGESFSPIPTSQSIADFGQSVGLRKKAKPTYELPRFSPAGGPDMGLIPSEHEKRHLVRIDVCMVYCAAIQVMHHFWIAFQIDKVCGITRAANAQLQMVRK